MKIKTREDKIIEIDTIERIDILPGEKLLVSIDIGFLPPARAREFMDKVREKLQPSFPDNEVLVVSNKVKFSVIT